MTNTVKEFLASQMAEDTNIQAVGLGVGGKMVVFVLDDSAPAIASYSGASPEIEIIRCSGFSAVPSNVWPDKTSALAYKDRRRPVPGGASVAHERVTAGTVSGYVINNETGDLCLLSNHHVLVSPIDAPSGRRILQPGPADGGTLPGDHIADLVRWVNIREENISRFVDCAIARPVNDDLIDQNIIALGIPQGVVEPYIGQELVKSGRSSETTRGQCVVIDADVKVNYGTFERTIQRCIITGVPGWAGDSGSMMMDMASHDAVALLFAGGSLSDGTMITVGCRFDLVQQLLGVSLPPSPEPQRQFWLDLSHWQGDISSLDQDMTGQAKVNIDGLTPASFSQMKARGVDGVVLKAAQGKDIIDPKFATYYTYASNVGLKVAAYDYVDPVYSAEDHFANFMRAVGDRRLEYVAMDCEASSNQSRERITAVIQAFGDRLRGHYNRLPWIYTSPYFWNTFVLPWSGWAAYPLWIAYWSRTALWPVLPEAWKGVDGQPVMWQFLVSNFGSQLGVGSKQVDLNTMLRSGIRLIEGDETPPPPQTVALDVIINGSGYVSPAGGRYPVGTTVRLEATPEDGWRFSHWSGDASGSDPITSVVMDDDKVIGANFVQEDGNNLREYIHYQGVTQVRGQNIRRQPTTVNNTPIGVLDAGQTIRVFGLVRDAGGNVWANIGWDYTRKCDLYAAVEYNGRKFIDLIRD